MPLIFLLCEPSVVFLLVFIEVALIVAACRATVSGPITHTDPAELVPTQRASHMVAPLVLLYMPMAAGTRLRISHYPLCVLALGALFLNPQPCVLTVIGSVVRIAALEAESVATVALDLFQDTRMVLSFGTKLALHVRTPSDVFVLIRQGLRQPLPVLI